jgi:hypothetical protein
MQTTPRPNPSTALSNENCLGQPFGIGASKLSLRRHERKMKTEESRKRDAE